MLGHVTVMRWMSEWSYPLLDTDPYWAWIETNCQNYLNLVYLSEIRIMLNLKGCLKVMGNDYEMSLTVDNI